MSPCQTPYIDPQMARILAEMPAPGEPLPVAEERRLMREDSAVWNTPVPVVATVRELAIPAGDREIPARLYQPAPERPLIVYLHGGGWVLGDLDTHDRLMRLLAVESGANVLGVDYRLAPEYPFPAPLDDVLAVLRWLPEMPEEFQVNTRRVVLAGDSAGANLALGAMLARRDAGESLPCGAVLFYGCYQSDSDCPAHRAFGDGRFGLASERMDWFWRQYLGEHGAGHPHAEPLLADLHGLPPMFLSAAGLDCLLDDTRELAARLEAHGVRCQCRIYPGVIHGFLRMSNRLPVALTAIQDACAKLRVLLDCDEQQPLNTVHG